MAKYEQTQDEIGENLRIQYEFIKRSIESWKSGFEGEAIRIAATLRVLLHDTDKSTSLLSQLNKKSEYFLSTNMPVKKRNLLGHHGLVIMRIKARAGGAQSVTWTLSRDGVVSEPAEGSSDAAPGVDWVPRFSEDPPQGGTSWLAFDRWWDEVVIQEPAKASRKRLSLTRKQLVSNIANKDGGSHLDPKLTGAYAEITRRNSLGIMARGYGGSAPVKPPHFASAVQIGFETLATIDAWNMLD